MPLYKYSAVDMAGKKTSGQEEADGRDELYAILKKSGLYLTNCKEVEKAANKRQIKSADLAELAHQLGTMLASGISITRAMSIIVQRIQKKKLKTIYGELNTMLMQGIPLSEAMTSQVGAFPILMINMVRAGENSGRIEDVMFRLAKHYEKDSKLQQKVKSAMIYPLFLLVLIIVVVIVIFVGILPTFFSMFEGMELPWNTKIVLGMSKFMTSHWIASAVIFVIAVIAIIRLVKTKPVIRFNDRVKIKLPLIGRLLKIVYTARFARNLSSLYASGMSIINCLQLCKGLMGTTYIEDQFDKVVEDVRNGVPLSNAIAGVDGFDPKLASAIFVGEESGRIDEILENMADSYDYEADQAITKLVTLIEPIMIIIMAGVVLFIVLSVIMPMYQYYHSIGQ